MEIFKFTDYKPWLLRTLRDGRSKSGLQSALAKEIGCKPAYLSRILNEDAHLSLEQASDAADFFTLSLTEKSYLIAMVGERRAAKENLRLYWQKKMQEALNDSMELKNHVILESHLTENQMLVYYSSWYYSAIHIAVGIPSLQTVESLADHFQISKAQCQKFLKFLQDVELIKKEGIKFLPHKNKLHLDKKSPLLQGHHLNWKHKTIEMMQAPKSADFNYMSVVSISKKDYENIRKTLFESVERCRATTRESKDEILAFYSIDLFKLDRSDAGDLT